eukprot:3276098-Pyramimonas_sp.AAC.1
MGSPAPSRARVDEVAVQEVVADVVDVVMAVEGPRALDVEGEVEVSDVVVAVDEPVDSRPPELWSD